MKAKLIEYEVQISMKIIIAIALLSTGIFAQDAFDRVSWLAGCWGGEMDEGAKYEECWTAPINGFMQGSGRISQNGKIVMREHMTLEQEGNEIVMYVLGYSEKLKPEDQGTIPFRLTRSSTNELVFENPKHDYPQRIVYTKDEKGDMIARIELIDGTKPMKFPLNNLSRKQ